VPIFYKFSQTCQFSTKIANFLLVLPNLFVGACFCSRSSYQMFLGSEKRRENEKKKRKTKLILRVKESLHVASPTPSRERKYVLSPTQWMWKWKKVKWGSHLGWCRRNDLGEIFVNFSILKWSLSICEWLNSQVIFVSRPTQIISHKLGD